MTFLKLALLFGFYELWRHITSGGRTRRAAIRSCEVVTMDSTLPEDVMIEILARLPVKSLLRSGSCNGLICLSDEKTFMVICNPATNEYIEVPFNLDEIEKITGWFNLSFGHDPHTDNYKVVRIDMYFSSASIGDPGHCNVYVYTLGTKQWRRIQTPPYRLAYGRTPYLNGSLHWVELGNISRWDHRRQFTNCKSIISFDLKSEKFQEVPWFTFPDSKLRRRRSVGVLQGCLSTYVSYPDKGLTEIWLMKQYGVEQSWTKLFSINFPFLPSHRFVPLVVRRKGEILLKRQYRGGLPWRVCGRNNTYAYDPINNKVHEYDLGNIDLIDIHAYVESLVSIVSYSGGKTKDENNKQQRNGVS
ncbi:hypothetical protein IFM89_028774 [Coptis chinensis]|uniref:F-box associated beta-propeller type 1 domain-containing protein n=1 Tax=Coptis chinensis TaxID=261450 RepID=A0A835LFE3_9MAGN|nr:hypothetical protein IFM89_028774 [Coptis chinensis]